MFLSTSRPSEDTNKSTVYLIGCLCCGFTTLVVAPYQPWRMSISTGTDYFELPLHPHTFKVAIHRIPYLIRVTDQYLVIKIFISHTRSRRHYLMAMTSPMPSALDASTSRISQCVSSNWTERLLWRGIQTC